MTEDSSSVKPPADSEPVLVLLVLKEQPDPDGIPWQIRVRETLKRALRCCQLKCTHARLLTEEPPPAPADAAEVIRLQALVEHLAARCAGQADLLAARAERTAP